MNAGREGGDGLGGGVHVGGLGVVVELDAVAGGHVLQAMLDGMKLFDGAANSLGRDLRQPRGHHRGQHILVVVRAFERNPAQGHDLFDRRIPGGAINHKTLLQPGSL